MKLTDKQQSVLDSENHLLVIGGPGSGKTTVSILKAAQVIDISLEKHQNVLFLSFARASVSRVIEAIEYEHSLPKETKRRIEVDTYHSFFWSILKAHGYLIGLPKVLQVLTPQKEAIYLSEVRRQNPITKMSSESDKQTRRRLEDQEKQRLLYQEGMVSFDFFAQGVYQIISKSIKIRELVSNRYPIIIVDEFQDTNQDQWDVIKSLSSSTTTIALADPEQRIYDWIGADPKRLEQFEQHLSPEIIDFAQNNHRSTGSDICVFGNDILNGHFTKKTYTGINIIVYEPNVNSAYIPLVAACINAIKKAKAKNPGKWSVAILVPTKLLTRKISEVLDNPPRTFPPISHTPYIEVDAAILSAEVISYLMEPISNDDFPYFVRLLVDYYRGRGGAKPTVKDLQEADNYTTQLDDYLDKLKQSKPLNKRSVLAKTLDVFQSIVDLDKSGNPESDWRAIVSLMNDGCCSRLKKVCEDSKNLRLLKRGELLRQNLSGLWQQFGVYKGALEVVRTSFVQQHFSTKQDLERGVLIMNMHKAKGKQFDEVIIFEDWPKRKGREIVSNSGRIVRSNLAVNIDDQARQNFRVSVTRAKNNTTILTPKGDLCVLLR